MCRSCSASRAFCSMTSRTVPSYATSELSARGSLLRFPRVRLLPSSVSCCVSTAPARSLSARRLRRLPDTHCPRRPDRYSLAPSSRVLPRYGHEPRALARRGAQHRLSCPLRQPQRHDVALHRVVDVLGGLPDSGADRVELRGARIARSSRPGNGRVPCRRGTATLRPSPPWMPASGAGCVVWRP